MSKLTDEQVQIALAEKAGAKWCLVRDFGSEVIRLLLPNDMSQIEPEDITTLNKCPFNLVIDWMHLKEIPPITDWESPDEVPEIKIECDYGGIDEDGETIWLAENKDLLKEF